MPTSIHLLQGQISWAYLLAHTVCNISKIQHENTKHERLNLNFKIPTPVNIIPTMHGKRIFQRHRASRRKAYLGKYSKKET